MKVLAIGPRCAALDLIGSSGSTAFTTANPDYSIASTSGMPTRPMNHSTITRVNREDSVRLHDQSGTFAHDAGISL